MKINNTDFKDERVYNLINSFFDIWIGNLSSYSPSTRLFLEKKYRHFPSLFFNVSFEEIDEAFLCNIYSKIERKNLKGMNALLLHICEKNIIKLKNGSLIVRFKDRLLSGAALPSDIPFLFSDKVPMGLLSDPNAFTPQFWNMIFFFDITVLPFENEELRQAAFKFCEGIKSNDPRSLNSRLRDLFVIKNILFDRFLDKDLSFFTLKNIRTEIIQPYYDKQSFNSRVHRLTDFLIWLCENGYVIDPNLLPLLEFKSFLTTGGRSTEQLRSFFAVDHIEWNCFIHIQRLNVKVNTMFYLNSPSKLMRELLEEHIYQLQNPLREMHIFTAEFEDSLSGNICISPNDLSFDSFIAQINYFKKKYSNNYMFIHYIVGFYTFIAAKYNAQLFNGSGIPTSILHKRGLARKLYDGFQLIPLNPFEDVPKCDQWLLCFPIQTGKNSDLSVGNHVVFNFTEIKNPDYKDWAKYYVWHSNTSYTERRQILWYATVFFNFVTDVKEGTVLSIYTRPSNEKNITLEEILAYKTYIMNNSTSYRSRCSTIYAIRRFLAFLDAAGIIEVPTGAYYQLRVQANTAKKSAKPIPKEELALIVSQLQQNANSSESVFPALYELIFYLGLETEFRISQIMSLRTDCVRQTTKPNEYIVLSKTKTSCGEEIEQPISLITKGHIDKILEITAEYRTECHDDEMRNHLFLIPSPRKHNAFGYASATSFTKYLHSVCEQLGLQQYSFENVRDTHMTLAEEYQIRNGLSEMKRTVLTGHSLPKTDLFYVKTDIRDMLEAVHGMIIGNIDIAGNVAISLDSTLIVTENEVSHRCGYCPVDCTNNSYLDCLICDSFFTTVDRLPYFDERIRIIDTQIKSAPTNHDKEDYICIKRLLLAYKVKILELMAETEDSK